MLRLSYVNERPGESVVVVVRPWDYAAKVAPGGRLDILLESRGVEKPEVLFTHRAEGEVEIQLSVDVVSISGEGVEWLAQRPDEAGG